MNPRLVVFDVDGTLIDSQGQILAAMAAAFAAAGRAPPSRAEVLAVVGLSLPVALRRLMPGVSEADAEAAVAAYRSAFHAGAGSVPPLYPGTRAMLDGLAGAPATLLGIATGKSRRGLDRVLSAHGLAGRFVTRQVADDHPSKPDPSMLRAALAEAGVPPSRAVMIGDTAFDLAMGRAAGVATVAVTWGYHPAGALTAADAVLDDWAELGPALDRLLDAA